MIAPPARLELPIRAAIETIRRHGLAADRCDILQDGHTLVLRLNEDLVARVVAGPEGARSGTAWFAKENELASYLTRCSAPVIPLHPALPHEPQCHLGYVMNFWTYVASLETDPTPDEVGRTLRECHRVLADFPSPLAHLHLLTESLALVPTPAVAAAFDQKIGRLLERHLEDSLSQLSTAPAQALHGDAHAGNLMNTDRGLLWTDWEDAFHGPVEWDLASIIWNARILDRDLRTADTILDSYRQHGGQIDPSLLEQCLIARAAVMTVWYPILYPDPTPERLSKLQARLAYLAERTP